MNAEDRHEGQMRHIVNGLLLRDGQVLLARRSKGRKAYPDLWSFPGGHAERGESRLETLHRELIEEIGVVPLQSRLLTSFPDPHSALREPVTYHLYAVEHWNGAPEIRDHEHSCLEWFALSDAAELTELALREYRDVFLALQRSGSGGIG